VAQPQGRDKDQQQANDPFAANGWQAPKAVHQQSQTYRAKHDRHQVGSPSKPLAQIKEPLVGEPALVYGHETEKSQDRHRQKDNAKDLDP
jgi:hypothetical protein